MERAARMAPDQDSSERFPGIGPQTAAARGGARTPPETEPQPKPGEIRVRRLTEPERAPEPEPAPPPKPHAPPGRRERASLLLGLGSAIGVVAFLVSSLGTAGLPAGDATFEAKPSSRAVAPGGRIVLTGSDAPESTPLVLETRGKGAGWRVAGRTASDEGGEFRLEGRVLASPGPVAVRARSPEGAVAAPVRVTVRPLRLASVGDINLGDVPGQAIEANGPAWPWESAGKWLRAADISFGNLESAVSRRGTPFPKQFNFRGTPAALAGLRRHTGIDVLNLANNHVGDYGPQATLDTVRGVERQGMKAVGA